MLRIEVYRNGAWNIRGEAPFSGTVEQIRAQAERLALNGPTRAFLNGELVAECPKLTKKRAAAIFGL